MKLSLFNRFAAFFLGCFFPLLSFAASWPVFSPPDAAFLIRNNLIDTSQCPRGQGKLVPNVVINIHEQLCRTFCPESWLWKGWSDGKCHDLESDLKFQSYDIVHYRKKDGTTSYSKVVAKFGSAGSSRSAFKFTVKTIPGEFWYCVQANRSIPNITCANDI